MVVVMDVFVNKIIWFLAVFSLPVPATAGFEPSILGSRAEGSTTVLLS
jgi:hypothetical protein